MASDDVSGGLVAGGDGGCPVLSGYDPLDPGELRDPFPSYARARREAPVFYSEEYGFWSVTRLEDVLAILRDTEHFSNRSVVPIPLPPEKLRDRLPVYPNVGQLVFLDEPEHLPARRMAQAPFTPKRVRQVAPMIRARAQQLLSSSGSDRHLEFVNEYAAPLALAVIGHILGIPEEDFALLERAVDGQVRIISGACDEDEIPAVAQGQLEYWEYLLALIETRRRDPQDDFTSVLVNYSGERGWTPTADEIARHLNSILGGGFSTSSQMMSFGIKSMLENRSQWELLKSDRSLLPGAVEECVRHRSPIKRMLRLALADVEVCGVEIPKGALVALLLQSANRDESVFSEAQRFDIARNADNIAFGRGVHFCLGAPLAKLEMRITLETLLDLAPNVSLLDGHEFEYQRHVFLEALPALHLDLGPAPSSVSA